jgi:hypothetical protein
MLPERSLTGHRILPVAEPDLIPTAALPHAGQVVRSLLPACQGGRVLAAELDSQLYRDRLKIIKITVPLVSGAIGGVAPSTTFRFSKSG